MTLLEKVKNKYKCDVREGYSTGVIYAHKDGHTAHHVRPLSLEIMRLSQTMIHTGIQQTYQSWNKMSGI